MNASVSGNALVKPCLKYTNADSKISLYVRVHINIIKFRILNSKNSQVIYRTVCEMFIYKHTYTI